MKTYDMNNLNKNAFPEMPEEFENRVERTLMRLPNRKGGYSMEKRTSKHSMKKVVVLTAAAVMILGTTVFAAGKVSQYVSHGTNIPVYKDFPAEEQMEKDYGFSPLLVEKFSNGYEFQAAYDSDVAAQDDEGNVAESYKDVDFTYEKDGDTIDLAMNTSKVEAGEENGQDMAGTQTEQIQDTEVKYTSYVNKCVPPDYEMTEEDKAAEADGSIVFSVGSPEVTIQTNQDASFTVAGVNYHLFYSGEELGKEDLLGMVGELINNQ